MKNYTHREIIREFLFFLKTNNVYKQYIQNIKIQKIMFFESWINYINPLTIKPIRILVNKGKYTHLIDYAFIWSETNEGHEFWSKLDKKWRNLIIEEKIKVVPEKL